MNPEEVFGVNAGKVWHVLNRNGKLSVSQIAKLAKLNLNEVYAALGWLGREGKIEILREGRKIIYRLR